jgi:hypothetical protein
MGNFKIEINGTGGHGDDRDAMPGEVLRFGERTPDHMAFSWTQTAKDLGWLSYGGSALLIHWPGEPGEVVDDLATGKRLHGAFKGERETEEHIMQFFAWTHLPAELGAVSRTFAEAARRIVRTLPRNPERTVALRKLLEAKDAAVRALVAK